MVGNKMADMSAILVAMVTISLFQSKIYNTDLGRLVADTCWYALLENSNLIGLCMVLQKKNKGGNLV